MSTEPVEQLCAESAVKPDSSAPETLVRPADGLLHELQVYQIELEAQNENLRQTQLALEESRDRYLDLYDFAPVAYFTLNRDGLILEANFTCAALLGLERKNLYQRRFAGFIASRERERWYGFFLDVLKNNSPCQCELALERTDGQLMFTHLDCLRIETGKDGYQVRIVLTDITERRRAESLLRDSEEKFHAIFEGTLDGVVLIDDTGMIVDCNPEFIRQSGRTLGQLKQTRIWELRPADKAELAKNIFFEAMQTGSAGSADFMYKRPDGKVIHVGVRGATISIGGKCYLQCITHDITERRQMEMELEQSRQALDADRRLFQAILDNAPLGIWMLGVDHKLRFLNKTFCNAVGITEQQFILANHYADLLPPAVTANCMKSDRECFEQQTPHLSEEWLPFVDGREHLLEITKVKLFDQEGRTIGLIGLAKDITERRQAAEIAHLGAQKNRLLFENSYDALMTLAPPAWKFTSANAATLKLFGASSQAEFTALTPWDVSPERQPDGRLSGEKAHEMLAIALREGSHAFEWQHQQLNGQSFPASVLLTRIELGDEVFVQSTVRDITDLKRAETEILEYQQLLRELAAQGVATREAELKHVAREVHDELGQLLTALRMDISLLRIQFGERDPALMIKIQDMLVLVDKAIRGVRDVALNLRPPALDMGIGPALTWLSSEFTARTSINCTLRIVDEPASLDDARNVALFRIVQESLTNIARHAGATLVEITVGQRGDDITVEIRDDGLGFDLDAVAGKKSFGLMGMKERAIAVCGKVKVCSTPMMGTVVSVHVPLYLIHPGRRIND
ncbi:MAG: PAS domain S-box protein [Gallionella sp.]|jgi:PAS domain S-box-containing protein